MKTVTVEHKVYDFDELTEASQHVVINDTIKFYLDCIPYEQMSPEMQQGIDRAEQMQSPWFSGSYIMDYAKDEVLSLCRSYGYLENGKIFNDKE